MLLSAAGLVALLAVQPPAPARSPYLDVVRGYGPGTEAASVAALEALGVDDADEVLDHLDRRVCASAGARGCGWHQRQEAGFDVAGRVQAAWRILYPRALGLHVEALAASDPRTGRDRSEPQRVIVLALIERIEDIAAEPGMPSEFAAQATRGRHLLVWVLQLLRHQTGLALTLERFDAAQRPVHDRDLALARAALEELRATPAAVRASPRIDAFATPLPREARLAAEEARRIGAAVRAYEEALRAYPDTLEAHLRLARLLLRLDRRDAAEPHLRRVAALDPDRRQTYLSQLFLADLRERRGDRAGALAAYEAAHAAWPAAQSPVIAVARLHALAGDTAAADRALLRLRARPGRRERSDPWHGYTGAQAWRLPAAILALQASFEPLR